MRYFKIRNIFKIIFILLVLILPLSLAGCVPYIIGGYYPKSGYQAPKYYPPKFLPHNVEKGIASWYGPGFQGRPTASGQIYNMYDLTAASRTLPLDTYAYVTNMENKRSVEVYVNDRGPYYGGRIIDLSYAAARALNMVGAGTALVRVQYLGPSPVSQNIINGFGTRYIAPMTGYTLQFAAYTIKAKALKKAKEMRKIVSGVHIITKIVRHTSYFAVVLGKFSSLKKAYIFAKVIAKYGFDVYITKRD
jgi:rare lipoprotein A